MKIEERIFASGKISVLPGLLAIRHRPRLYTEGETNQARWYWLINEIIKRMAKPEFYNRATHIDISFEPPNIISITDNGRGLPVFPSRNGFTRATLESETEFGLIRPSQEFILTTLHAGDPQADYYEVAGFLFGLAPVLVALSGTLKLTTWFAESTYEMAFWEGAILSLMSRTGPAKKQGTQLKFTPSQELFNDVLIDPKLLLQSCRKIELESEISIQFRDL